MSSLGIVVFGAFVAHRAHAHPETTPTLVNRYVTLTLHGSTAEASVALLYGAVPAQQVRRDADLNNDGLLGQPEIAALTQRLQAESITWLAVLSNGETLKFAPTLVIDLGGNLAVTAAALVAEARMDLNLAARDHSFDLRPGVGPRFLGETEVTCATGGGWALQESSSERPGAGSDARQHGRARSYKAVGAVPAGWNVRFRLRPIGPSDQAGTWGLRPRLIATLATVLLACASCIAWNAWRRRKSPTRS